jgi:hypothetical protein
MVHLSIPRAVAVQCTEDALVVSLSDGRVLSVPLVWFPRLAHATPEQRSDFELLGEGEGVYWPAVDEDVSVAGFIEGRPSIKTFPS